MIKKLATFPRRVTLPRHLFNNYMLVSKIRDKSIVDMKFYRRELKLCLISLTIQHFGHVS